MKKIIIILLTITLMGCQDYSELNKLAIVTAVGIDKEDEKYEVSVLIANSPKTNSSNKEGEAKTTVYKAKGNTVAQAIKGIDLKSPKELYFSHVNSVIISKEIGKEGFLKVSDFLMRNPETRNRFYLLQIDNEKASTALKVLSPLESYPSQSIATLIESSQNSRDAGLAASYSNFIGRVLEKGYEPIMSTIKINGDPAKGSKQSNLETSEPLTYLSLGPIAIYKSDKLVNTTSQKETEIIQILLNETKEITYGFKYKNENISIFSNMTKTKINIKNKNHALIDVNINGDIYEISDNINLNDYKEIEKINKKWNKTIKKDIEKLIQKLQNDYQSDILGIGNLIYKKYPKYFNNINWVDKFKNLKIDVNVKTEIISSGSLTKVIKEDK